MKKISVLVYIDNMERFRFFNRLSLAFNTVSVDCIFVTSSLAVHVRSKAAGLSNILVQKRFFAKHVRADFNKSFDVKRGVLTNEMACVQYSSVYTVLCQKLNGTSIEGCLIWNGEKVADLAVADFCKERQIPRLYLEVANVPGKLFVDPCGVNAKSALCKD